MHLSDSKREFFAPRGGREICMVGPLSLNGNAAAADKVRAASNSNAVFCNGTFTTYDVRMGGGWGSGLAQKQTRVLIYCMSVMRTTGRGWKSLQKFGRHMWMVPRILDGYEGKTKSNPSGIGEGDSWHSQEISASLKIFHGLLPRARKGNAIFPRSVGLGPAEYRVTKAKWNWLWTNSMKDRRCHALIIDDNEMIDGTMFAPTPTG